MSHLVAQQEGGLSDLASSSFKRQYPSLHFERLCRAALDVQILREVRGQWCLAHVMDAMIQQDYAGAQELLALTVIALDQVSLDAGGGSLRGP